MSHYNKQASDAYEKFRVAKKAARLRAKYEGSLYRKEKETQYIEEARAVLNKDLLMAANKKDGVTPQNIDYLLTTMEEDEDYIHSQD